MKDPYCDTGALRGLGATRKSLHQDTVLQLGRTVPHSSKFISALTQAGLCAHQGLFMDNHTDHVSREGSGVTKAKRLDLEDRSMEAEQV